MWKCPHNGFNVAVSHCIITEGVEYIWSQAYFSSVMYFLSLVTTDTLSQTDQWIIWTFPAAIIGDTWGQIGFLCLGKQMFVCANGVCYWLSLLINLHVDDTAAASDQHWRSFYNQTFQKLTSEPLSSFLTSWILIADSQFNWDLEPKSALHVLDHQSKAQMY